MYARDANFGPVGPRYIPNNRCTPEKVPVQRVVLQQNIPAALLRGFLCPRADILLDVVASQTLVTLALGESNVQVMHTRLNLARQVRVKVHNEQSSRMSWVSPQLCSRFV